MEVQHIKVAEAEEPEVPVQEAMHLPLMQITELQVPEHQYMVETEGQV